VGRPWRLLYRPLRSIGWGLEASSLGLAGAREELAAKGGLRFQINLGTRARRP
jgi:hypothetical protein